MIRMVVESASDLELHRKVAALYAHYNATVYRSLAEGEEKIYAFTLLFPDEAAIETFLAEAPNGPADELLRHATIDCYVQSSYALIDGVWTPTDAIQDSRIMWPGNSPVRIVIETACENNPAMYAMTSEEISQTRAEPGCLQYAWYEDVDRPGDLLLLELWDNQVIYDAHWFGRMKTSDYRGDSGRKPSPRQRGEVSREFYRHQPFEYHYGRLLPADTAHYSHTVIWGAQ